MARKIQSVFLLDFVKKMKARKALPKHIELSRIGPVYLASIFDELKSEVIAESIYTGMDVNPDVAVLKGLVEMTERRAFSTGRRSGLSSCQTERSDGFAAFPLGIGKNPPATARSNARFEAIERFAWASWWDDKTIGHDAKMINPQKSTASEALLLELKSLTAIEDIYRITPRIANDSGTVVAIYFAFLRPFGVVSGGACGSSTDLESIHFGAVCELSRHALAVKRIKDGQGIPTTFYERRLAHFGLTEAGSLIVKERIGLSGTSALTLPDLQIDEAVPHVLDDLISVHRCYFVNQPPFVGGQLDRLCL